MKIFTMLVLLFTIKKLYRENQNIPKSNAIFVSWNLYYL